MSEYREVTRAEREVLFNEGIFDINGNMPFHPGYTGIHHKADGSYVFRQRSTYGTEAWFSEEQAITDPEDLFAIEHRSIRKPWWKFWA